MSNAKLIIRSTGAADQELTLSAITSIGRASDNSICIDDPNISRYHAVIEARSDGYWLSDLGSRNGTTVNGQASASGIKLQDGDLISVGDARTLEFHFDEARADSRAVSARAAPSQAMAVETLSVEPSESASKQSSRTSPLLVTGIAVIVAVVLVAGVALLILPTRSGRGNAPPQTGGAQTGGAQTGGAQTGGAGGREASEPPAKSDDSSASTIDREGAQPAEAEADATKPGEGLEPGLVDIGYMAASLARQISERSGDVFAPDFVKEISRSTRDYRIDTMRDAQPYSRDIKAAFNEKALPPLLGLILAMSQSKFKEIPGGTETGGGLWNIPVAVAKKGGYLREGETEAALKDPKRSAQIAAAYIKNLMAVGGGKENFMYAIACFGAPLEEIPNMRSRLDEKDPLRTTRLDFWKMVKSGVVSQPAAARVVRFIAAGIVAENPEKFGLGAKPLSSLVTD
jgi:pSer/pThr/pTyr-binding forkhead associated (FHA) protein